MCGKGRMGCSGLVRVWYLLTWLGVVGVGAMECRPMYNLHVYMYKGTYVRILGIKSNMVTIPVYVTVTVYVTL